ITERVEAKASEHPAYGRLEVVPAGVLELMLRLRIPFEEVLVAASEAWLELVHLGFELAQVGGRSESVLLDRPGRVGEDLLLHEPNAGTASQGDIPRVRRLESRRDAQQCRLPHPVRPDKTD